MTQSDGFVLEGSAFLEAGEVMKAIACFRNAQRLSPNDFDINVKLGMAFLSLKDCMRWAFALGCFEKALGQRPNDVRLLLKTGRILHALGKQQKSLECFLRAICIEPWNMAARVAAMIHQIPVIYDDEDQINVCRRNYETHLQDLEFVIHHYHGGQLTETVDALLSDQPFYLPYQGLNDKDLQIRYATLVNAAMSARYPEYAVSRRLLPLVKHSKIRVGIVSAFFRNHSNWKIPIKGWVENLDRNRFSLFGYHIGKTKDSATNRARECMDVFAEDCFNVDELCKRIIAEELHVIIYPGLGMDRLTMKLAALRLAPIQCASWGHPVTSGLSSIDYFLSSDLMEPPQGDEHYSEQLVRLPNLSIHYTPTEFHDTGLTRGDFGLRPDTVVYVCAQSLFKLLPQFDYVFAAIAKQVPNSQFIFIDLDSYHLSRHFEKRLTNAFDRLSLCHRDHIIMVGQMETDHFGSLLRQSDVFLDSIGWSGCNTTLEALQFDLPIVTMPGPTMRSRHSSAILHMMGMQEMVATDENDYIEKAVKLGNDHKRRQWVRENVKANKNRVTRDNKAIDGLEEFLVSVVMRLGRSSVQFSA